MLNFDDFEVLTFDCYGTLIDWESGIWEALRPVLANHRIDRVITAQQAKSYKPSLKNFYLAFERIGLPTNKILHVAQSLFHDIVPAKALGLSTVWINRRHNKGGFGATPPAQAQPDLEVPDLQTLAGIVGSM